jgi:superfamily II DNA or RNA helicase
MKLRPYQTECIESVFREFETVRSTLAVAATGTGKTTVFGSIADKWLRMNRGRVCMIAHREELVMQSKGRLDEMTGASFEIEMAEYSAASGGGMFRSPGIVASVQSLCQDRRLMKHDPADYGLLIIDEAHHAAGCAKSYMSIVRHFSKNPSLKILGVTATPDRADEMALGETFDSVAFEFGVQDAIEGGWLVPVRQRLVTVGDLDLSRVKTTGGDLNAAELEAVMTEESMLHKVVSPSIELIGDQPTLVFAAGVSHAHQMADIFNRHRQGMAVAIDGETEKEKRRHYLRQFKDGRIQVIVNCAVLTEGTDLPNVRNIIMARPTKSRSLYAQIAGRGTRPLPEARIDDHHDSADARRAAIARSSKPDCVIVDFVGNSGRHKLIHASDVLGGKYSDEIVEEAEKKIRERAAKGVDTDVLEAMKWVEEQMAERRREERAKLIAQASYFVRDVSPFDLFDIRAGREPGYLRGKPSTERQRAYLRSNGVRNPETLSLHKATKLIDELKRRQSAGLCTAQQAKLLAAYGYDTNVTKAEAAKRITDEINPRISRRVSATAT